MNSAIIAATAKPSPNGHGQPDIAEPRGIPICDTDAEQHVLGSLLLAPSKAVAVAAIVRPSDFSTLHQPIYQALLKLSADGRGGDLALLAAELRQSGCLDDVGGLAYLADLMHKTPVAAHAEFYAEAVHKRALARAVALQADYLLSEASKPDADAVKLVARAQEVFHNIGGRAGRIDYGLMTAPEMLGKPIKVDYLVEGVLPARQPALMFAPQKAMKTSVAIDMSVSLATGGHFLGYFRVPRPVRVAVMSGESGMATLQETIGRIVAASHCDLDLLGNLMIGEKLPRFGDAEHVAAMRRMIEAHALEVVFIDPAYLCLPGTDAGNVFIFGDLLRSMAEMFTEVGATLILIHHARKNLAGDPYGVPELSNAAWSGFAEFARAWIMLNRREPYAPGSGLHRLWLAVGGSAGHSGLWGLNIDEGPYSPNELRKWQVAIEKLEQIHNAAQARKEQTKAVKAQQRLDEDRKALVACMAKMKKPETKNTIRDRAGLGNGQRFDAAWGSLINDGAIIQDGTAKRSNGQEYEAFRLSDGGKA